MRRFLRSPIAQLVTALALTGFAVVAAARGEAAAGVVFLALAVVVPCTVLASHLRKDPRR